MKQSNLIIGGVLILLLLVGVWMYLLFFGTPKNPDAIFSNLGFGPDNDTSIVVNEAIEPVEKPRVDVTQESLRQLTTRKVAGYQAVQVSTTSAPYVYYAEAGTGHIYRINRVSGEEVRISNTTIPSVDKVAISNNGSYAVAQSNFNGKKEFLFANLNSTSSINFSPLPISMLDFKFVGDKTLIYLAYQDAGTVAKAINLETLSEEIIFTNPLRQIRVNWGQTKDDIHYIYPKPSAELDGYLYKIEGGKMSRLPVSGKGLTAIGNNERVLFGLSEERTYVGRTYNNEVKVVGNLYVAPMPEKCVFANFDPNQAWCAQASDGYSQYYPDEWYKGVISQVDQLWSINAFANSASFVKDITASTGREIDVINMSIAGDDSALFFINKNDGALWTYEI